MNEAYNRLKELEHLGSLLAAAYGLWRVNVILEEREGGRSNIVDEKEKDFVDCLGKFVGKDVPLSSALKKLWDMQYLRQE